MKPKTNHYHNHNFGIISAKYGPISFPNFDKFLSCDWQQNMFENRLNTVWISYWTCVLFNLIFAELRPPLFSFESCFLSRRACAGADFMLSPSRSKYVCFTSGSIWPSSSIESLTEGRDASTSCSFNMSGRPSFQKSSIASGCSPGMKLCSSAAALQLQSVLHVDRSTCGMDYICTLGICTRRAGKF